MGRINNLVKVMSNSPAVLEGYLGLNGVLDRGALGPELAERLALTVSEANGCDYCLASHGALARQLGISPEETLAARRAGSSDPKIDAALKFALAVVDRRGHVSDEELAGVKEAGYTDGDIAEIVAHVARTILTNYLNNVAATRARLAGRRAVADGMIRISRGSWIRLRGAIVRRWATTEGSSVRNVARYGLVIVLLWIGGMKFTAYEAEGIRPLVANSPLMGWVYRVMSVGGFSSLLGVVEVAIGLLIALRPVWPMGSAVGSGLAAGMFLTDAELPGHHARLGAEPGRFPGPVGHAGAVLAQGRRPAGSRAVYGRRGAGGAPIGSRRPKELAECPTSSTTSVSRVRSATIATRSKPRPTCDG